MSDDLLVEDLTVAFDSGGYVIKPLDGLSFKADDGELVVLLGPSGCGKTTLLSCLAGLLTPTGGRVEFGSIVVNELRGPALSQYRRHTVGVVFQAFNLIPSLQRARQRRRPDAAGRRVAQGGQGAGQRVAEPGRARRASASPPGPAVRWSAAAGRDRPRARRTIRRCSWRTSRPPTSITFRSRASSG